MVDILTIVFIGGGLLFFFGATIGLMRFPDFYTRMHAAGKGDTLSTLFILLGFAIYNLHHFDVAHLLVSIKILLIGVFIFITSPTTTHALMNAGYQTGIEPWSNNGKQDKQS